MLKRVVKCGTILTSYLIFRCFFFFTRKTHTRQTGVHLLCLAAPLVREGWRQGGWRAPSKHNGLNPLAQAVTCTQRNRERAPRKCDLPMCSENDESIKWWRRRVIQLILRCVRNCGRLGSVYTHNRWMLGCLLSLGQV